MKIAFVSDNFYPELSGITESLLLITETLKARGHNIFFIVPRYSKKNYTLVEKQSQKTFYEKNITRLPSLPLLGSPTKQSRIVLPLGFGVWKLWRIKPDIIHTHTPFGSGIEALIASKLFGIPIVGTNHTVTQEFTHYPFLPKKISEKLLLTYIAWYFDKCSFMSSPSQVLVDEMKAHGLTKPAKQISNPINLSLFSVASDEEKKKSKEIFKLSKNTILYTGRLSPEKHVDVIISAIQKVAKHIPDVCLAIAGHGKDEAQLKSLARALGIEKQVLFLGFVPQQTIPLLYKGAEIFAIMSTSETQSLSLIQGMATGIPVLGANARALPEYITSKTGFLIEPGDAETLSQHIITLLKDEALRVNLGKEGRLFVEQFNKEAIAPLWESIYERTIH